MICFVSCFSCRCFRSRNLALLVLFVWLLMALLGIVCWCLVSFVCRCSSFMRLFWGALLLVVLVVVAWLLLLSLVTFVCDFCWLFLSLCVPVVLCVDIV